MCCQAVSLVHISALYIQYTRGGFRGGSEGSIEPAFDSEFHLHTKFWIDLINLGYHIYRKYSQFLLFALNISLREVNFTTLKLLYEW